MQKQHAKALGRKYGVRGKTGLKTEEEKNSLFLRSINSTQIKKRYKYTVQWPTRAVSLQLPWDEGGGRRAPALRTQRGRLWPPARTGRPVCRP